MEHAHHFDRKVDAKRWLDVGAAAVVRWDYVEPRARLTTGDGDAEEREGPLGL
jgi:hypothetical protein